MQILTDLERSQLTKLAAAWRRVAAPVGPLHAWWDFIFDAECLLKGRKPMLDETVQWYIQEGRDGLVKWGHWKAEVLDEHLKGD